MIWLENFLASTNVAFIWKLHCPNCFPYISINIFWQIDFKFCKCIHYGTHLVWLTLLVLCTKTIFWHQWNSEHWSVVFVWAAFCLKSKDSGIILYMCPVNERWCYNVTPSLIGWAHTQNDPWRLGVWQIPRTMSDFSEKCAYINLSLCIYIHIHNVFWLACQIEILYVF